ncbi:hypothetical protein RFI_25254 [Reticulomyxa filosa]|uniref:Uncharacterized protein n=1 Tax=Reticulomyxa filosa TaxID=46433 RepID=X6MFC5_RETFI|nr:hypothetical protein RFI_25254 [Reticulomyxa filosa]|eukprot:ETO12122.1 hypothetical protein RFI_25254 [Reticulomyxa filosa]
MIGMEEQLKILEEKREEVATNRNESIRIKLDKPLAQGHDGKGDEKKEEHKMNQRALEEAMETTFVKPRKEVEDKIYFESIAAFALKTKVKTAKPL